MRGWEVREELGVEKSWIRSQNEEACLKTPKDFPCGPVVGTHASNAWGMGSILSLGAKILHAMLCSQENTKKEKENLPNSTFTISRPQ